MLEGWTTLGYIAAHTSHARLGLMVGGVHYRAPGLWVKAATTLDVLSGGRAWLGIGAAWNERGVAGPRASRSRRSRTGSRCSRRRSGSATRCSRASAAPRRPSMAASTTPSACSTRPSRSRDRASRSWSVAAARRRPCGWSPSTPTPATSSGRPRRSPASTRSCAQHCVAVGRDPDEIERSTLQNIDPVLPGGGGRESVERIVERFGDLADAGAQHVILGMPNADDTRRLDVIGRDILPAVRDL